MSAVTPPPTEKLRIVILGLSITSSWGNGHATTYRGLMRALCRRGHEVLFLERDRPWYGANRDPVDLPTGSVDIHLATADAVVNFTPVMQVALQTQYDNITENFAFSARYRWEYRPGNELFVGAGQSALISNRGFIAQVSQATIRLGHTFRF